MQFHALLCREDGMVEKECEIDSNKKAWEYYKTKYKDKIKIDDDHIYIYNNRKVCAFDYSQLKKGKTPMLTSVPKDSGKQNVIVLGGDCFFNFNEKKISMFKKFTGEDEKLDSLLETMSEKKHYNVANFSLIPVTGAMNNLKGKINMTQKGLSYNFSKTGSFDRGDTFVYALSLYFDGREKIRKNPAMDLGEAGDFLSHSVLKESLQSNNYLILYDFLNCFETVEKYCSFFYGISGKETKRVIEQGKKIIKSATDIKKYIEFCESVWRLNRPSMNLKERCQKAEN